MGELYTLRDVREPSWGRHSHGPVAVRLMEVTNNMLSPDSMGDKGFQLDRFELAEDWDEPSNTED